MSSLDFYALKQDQEELLSFICKETNFSIYESYSDFEKELLSFKSITEIEQKYDIGTDMYGNGTSILLQLWHKQFVDNIKIEKIKQIKGKADSYRYSIRGFGLVQLYLGGLYKQNFISSSHLGTFDEKGAINHGYINGVNWEELKKEYNKIANYIKRNTRIKAQSRYLLKNAHENGINGLILKHQILEYEWNKSEYVLREKKDV